MRPSRCARWISLFVILMICRSALSQSATNPGLAKRNRLYFSQEKFTILGKVVDECGNVLAAPVRTDHTLKDGVKVRDKFIQHLLSP
jgi:hypothetical protein